MPTNSIALEEYIDSDNETVKLKLWFMWNWLKSHPKEDLFFVIRTRVNIYGYVDIDAPKRDYENPKWKEAENLVNDVYKNSVNAEDFEIKGIEALKNTIEKQCKKEYLKPYVLPIPSYQCGSLKYDSPDGKWTPGKYFIHIANACRPKSIFDDPLYLSKCLLDLMEKAKAEYGVEKLGTSTWLNSHPKWLALFPQEWMDNMGPVDNDVRWSGNFWGQFVNSKGIFNKKYGDIMRKTGEFPFKSRYSWCTFEPLKKHLEEYLKQINK